MNIFKKIALVNKITKIVKEIKKLMKDNSQLSKDLQKAILSIKTDLQVLCNLVPPCRSLLDEILKIIKL